MKRECLRCRSLVLTFSNRTSSRRIDLDAAALPWFAEEVSKKERVSKTRKSEKFRGEVVRSTHAAGEGEKM